MVNRLKTLISFVIPCYRSENTIEKVIDEIITTVSEKKEYDYEIVAVNDCSPDNVYDVLRRLANVNPKIKVLNFAVNAGKHTAVLAGYRVVNGEYIVTLDDDCQCPVYELWKLLKPLENDVADITTAEYEKKEESLIKRLGSDFNSWMSYKLIGKPKKLRIENLYVCKRFVIKEVAKYKNIYPYLEGLLLTVTKKIISIPMKERGRGDDNTTGFTFFKSLELLLNGMSAFSVKPLRMISVIGIMTSMTGFIWGTIVIIRKLLNPEILAGYSSLISVILFMGGVIMLTLGVLAEYLGRIFIFINASSQYVIRNTVNLDGDNNDI